MYGEQFADSLCSRGSGICRSLNGSYVSADHNGNQAAAYEFSSDQINVSRFYHSVCCLYRADQSLCLDHS